MSYGRIKELTLYGAINDRNVLQLSKMKSLNTMCVYMHWDINLNTLKQPTCKEVLPRRSLDALVSTLLICIRLHVILDV